MSSQVFLWVGFHIFIFAMLAIDLGLINRKAHVIGIKESLFWSVVWTVVALLFNLFIYAWRGNQPALQFFTAYLIERSLSVDNLFVFLIVFRYFSVPDTHQHKVLFWGILGALVMRATFIVAGVALVQRFHWVMYLFGAFLVFTAIKMAFEKKQEIHPERNPVLRLICRSGRVTQELDGTRFFTRRRGVAMATPLLVVLLVIESTDVVFAVDSIPAVFSITLDPFIAYTSNILAILGLRALYFALAGVLRLFAHLNYGICIILGFVGVKMLIADLYEIPVAVALGFVALVLAVTMLTSVLFGPKGKADASAEAAKSVPKG
jgi:tellurite resistance protein TerC